MHTALLQGLLTLTNGTTIEGIFGGSWTKKIEITKGVLKDDIQRSSETSESIDAAISELQ